MVSPDLNRFKADLVKGAWERLSGGPQKAPPNDKACAVSIARPKTAALVYDYVWAYSDRDVPESIRFGNVTDLERSMWLYMWSFIESIVSTSAKYKAHVDALDSTGIRHFTKRERAVFDNLGSVVGHLCEKVTVGKQTEEGQSFTDYIYNLVDQAFRGYFLDELQEYEKKPHSDPMDAFTRLLSMRYQAEYGTSVVPIYQSIDTRTLLYRPGNRRVLVASFEKLGIVDENAITWEQVLEFKKDIKALTKYKKLMHWLDENLVDKSPEDVAGILEEKLDDYRSALRKHGIKTKIGILQSAFDWRALVAGIVAAGATKNPIMGILTTGSVLVGNVSLKLAEAKLDYDTKKEETLPEIHWIYDISTKVK